MVRSGDWLVFSVIETGGLHRMKLDGTEMDVIHPERYPAFEIQRVEDGWVEFRVWNGGSPHDPRSFPDFRIPLE